MSGHPRVWVRSRHFSGAVLPCDWGHGRQPIEPLVSVVIVHKFMIGGGLPGVWVRLVKNASHVSSCGSRSMEFERSAGLCRARRRRFVGSFLWSRCVRAGLLEHSTCARHDPIGTTGKLPSSLIYPMYRDLLEKSRAWPASKFERIGRSWAIRPTIEADSVCRVIHGILADAWASSGLASSTGRKRQRMHSAPQHTRWLKSEGRVVGLEVITRAGTILRESDARGTQRPRIG